MSLLGSHARLGHVDHRQSKLMDRDRGHCTLDATLEFINSHPTLQAVRPKLGDDRRAVAIRRADIPALKLAQTSHAARKYRLARPIPIGGSMGAGRAAAAPGFAVP